MGPETSDPTEDQTDAWLSSDDVEEADDGAEKSNSLDADKAR
jgi:hypothetical protein